MTVITDKPNRPAHEAACGRRIRERALGQADALDHVPPQLIAAISTQIQKHCGHRRLKSRRLAMGWTVVQAVTALHNLVSTHQLRPVGVTERSWKDWETGVLPIAETQDLLCRLFETSPMALGFAHDYSPRSEALPQSSPVGPTDGGAQLGQNRITVDLAEGATSGMFGLKQSPVITVGHDQAPAGYEVPQATHFCKLEELPEDGQQLASHRTSGTPSADSVASVVRLGEWDVQRRQFLAASSAAALSALALPDTDSLTRRTAAADTGAAAVNVGRGEVEAVRQMTTALGNAAAELGGGHARHLAVRYLTQDVRPWLEGAYTQVTGRDLFAAVAQLIHLAGWMAQDEGNQGMAQEYYTESYRMAREAGSAELAATALRGLAVQSVDLGYRAAGVRLSEECVRLARSLQEPRAIAYYNATLANAAATDGDRRTATKALAASQTAIERASNTPGESWAAHYSPGRWAHDSGMILAGLGDLDAAEDHLHHALDIHGLDRRRTRAMVLADLGQVRLRRDDIDGALSAWTEFVDCVVGLRSMKVHDALHDMRARLDLNRCRGVAGVDELKERAAAIRTSPAPVFSLVPPARSS
jgi:tetratricopeptide (TPR) repeat protein